MKNQLTVGILTVLIIFGAAFGSSYLNASQPEPQSIPIQEVEAPKEIEQFKQDQVDDSEDNTATPDDVIATLNMFYTFEGNEEQCIRTCVSK